MVHLIVKDFLEPGAAPWLCLSTVEVSYANPLPEKKWWGLSEIIPWNINDLFIVHEIDKK